jgi:hypothetical protein
MDMSVAVRGDWDRELLEGVEEEMGLDLLHQEQQGVPEATAAVEAAVGQQAEEQVEVFLAVQSPGGLTAEEVADMAAVVQEEIKVQDKIRAVAVVVSEVAEEEVLESHQSVEEVAVVLEPEVEEVAQVVLVE